MNKSYTLFIVFKFQAMWSVADNYSISYEFILAMTGVGG